MIETGTLSRFKRALKRGDAPGAVVLRKQFSTVAEPLQDRRLGFTISTGTIDRQGDTVAVAGWDLTDYRRNPVGLVVTSVPKVPF